MWGFFYKFLHANNKVVVNKRKGNFNKVHSLQEKKPRVVIQGFFQESTVYLKGENLLRPLVFLVSSASHTHTQSSSVDG